MRLAIISWVLVLILVVLSIHSGVIVFDALVEAMWSVLKWLAGTLGTYLVLRIFNGRGTAPPS